MPAVHTEFPYGVKILEKFDVISNSNAVSIHTGSTFDITADNTLYLDSATQINIGNIPTSAPAMNIGAFNQTTLTIMSKTFGLNAFDTGTVTANSSLSMFSPTGAVNLTAGTDLKMFGADTYLSTFETVSKSLSIGHLDPQRKFHMAVQSSGVNTDTTDSGIYYQLDSSAPFTVFAPTGGLIHLYGSAHDTETLAGETHNGILVQSQGNIRIEKEAAGADGTIQLHNKRGGTTDNIELTTDAGEIIEFAYSRIYLASINSSAMIQAQTNIDMMAMTGNITAVAGHTGSVNGGDLVRGTVHLGGPYNDIKIGNQGLYHLGGYTDISGNMDNDDVMSLYNGVYIHTNDDAPINLYAITGRVGMYGGVEARMEAGPSGYVWIGGYPGHDAAAGINIGDRAKGGLIAFNLSPAGQQLSIYGGGVYNSNAVGGIKLNTIRNIDIEAGEQVNIAVTSSDNAIVHLGKSTSNIVVDNSNSSISAHTDNTIYMSSYSEIKMVGHGNGIVLLSPDDTMQILLSASSDGNSQYISIDGNYPGVSIDSDNILINASAAGGDLTILSKADAFIKADTTLTLDSLTQIDLGTTFAPVVNIGKNSVTAINVSGASFNIFGSNSGIIMSMGNVNITSMNTRLDLQAPDIYLGTNSNVKSLNVGNTNSTAKFHMLTHSYGVNTDTTDSGVRYELGGLAPFTVYAPTGGLIHFTGSTHDTVTQLGETHNGILLQSEGHIRLEKYTSGNDGAITIHNKRTAGTGNNIEITTDAHDILVTSGHDIRLDAAAAGTIWIGAYPTAVEIPQNIYLGSLGLGAMIHLDLTPATQLVTIAGGGFDGGSPVGGVSLDTLYRINLNAGTYVDVATNTNAIIAMGKDTQSSIKINNNDATTYNSIDVHSVTGGIYLHTEDATAGYVTITASSLLYIKGRDTSLVSDTTMSVTATNTLSLQSVSSEVHITGAQIAIMASNSTETGSYGVRLGSGTRIFMNDKAFAASSWSANGGALTLTDAQSDVDTYITNFGEVSLLNSINQAQASATAVTLQNAFDNGNQIKSDTVDFIVSGNSYYPEATNFFKIAVESGHPYNFYFASADGAFHIDTQSAYLNTDNIFSIAAGGAVRFKDTNLAAYIPLSESGTDKLDASFTAASIVGALNELKSDATSVTLQDAYDNGQTITTTSGNDLVISGAAMIALDSTDALSIAEDSSTASLGIGTTSLTLEITADMYTVYAGDSVDVGAVNDYDINAADISLEINGTGKLQLMGHSTADSSIVLDYTTGEIAIKASGALTLADTNKSGSTYSTDLVLSDASTEWDTFDTNFGEVSLLNAINQAKNATQPLTTKGDLVTYSTAVTRLGVGTNGQILTADSTATEGIKWDSPLWTEYSTTSLSASAVVTSFTPSTDGSVVFHVLVNDGTNMTKYTVNAVYDQSAGTVSYNEVHTTDIGDTSGIVLSVRMTSNVLELYATRTAGTWTVKGSYYNVEV